MPCHASKYVHTAPGRWPISAVLRRHKFQTTERFVNEWLNMAMIVTLPNFVGPRVFFVPLLSSKHEKELKAETKLKRGTNTGGGGAAAAAAAVVAEESAEPSASWHRPPEATTKNVDPPGQTPRAASSSNNSNQGAPLRVGPVLFRDSFAGNTGQPADAAPARQDRLHDRQRQASPASADAGDGSEPLKGDIDIDIGTDVGLDSLSLLRSSCSIGEAPSSGQHRHRQQPHQQQQQQRQRSALASELTPVGPAPSPGDIRTTFLVGSSGSARFDGRGLGGAYGYDRAADGADGGEVGGDGHGHGPARSAKPTCGSSKSSTDMLPLLDGGKIDRNITKASAAAAASAASLSSSSPYSAAAAALANPSAAARHNDEGRRGTGTGTATVRPPPHHAVARDEATAAAAAAATHLDDAKDAMEVEDIDVDDFCLDDELLQPATDHHDNPESKEGGTRHRPGGWGAGVGAKAATTGTHAYTSAKNISRRDFREATGSRLGAGGERDADE